MFLISFDSDLSLSRNRILVLRMEAGNTYFGGPGRVAANNTKDRVQVRVDGTISL